MLCFNKFSGTLSRLMLLIGLVMVSVIPARLGALAQNGSPPLWIVRSLYTSEYEVSEPKGLAFSAVANTFLLLDGSANMTMITMGEDHAGTSVIPEVQDDPLNAAFDNQTGSLFVLSRGKSELAKLKLDSKGLPDASVPSAVFDVNTFGIKDPQGIAFDPADGRLFILDAGNAQIVSAISSPTLGIDANSAQRISLEKLGLGSLRGIAYHPGNGHLFVAEPTQKKLYELTQSGDLVSSSDLAALGINNASAMTFAPSADNTDDPNIQDLFILDAGAVPTDSQIVELSLVAPAALPAGTTLLPASLVRTIDTSNASWNPSAPDPSGVDYWPARQSLLITDSEVEEMPNYFAGKNVFESTTSGNLISTCSTTSYTNEPTGMAINPNNNHIFITDDNGANDKVFEINLGPDGKYCTVDDTVTITNVATSYGVTDAEDVAYGNNTLFIAGGVDAEVYRIPLGTNGVLGGGDDGAMTHFDTLAMGFTDLEALGYNTDNGTLFIASPKASDRYLGETTTTGTLLRAYDLSLMGSAGNIRSDVTYAPGSQNPGIKNIYIASRGVDNNNDPNENDGKIWEINISGSGATPTRTPTKTSTPAPGPSPTSTNVPSTTDSIFADGFESGNFSAWSANKTDSGDLSVSATAALIGTRGMQAVIDDTVTIFLTDDRPAAEPRYRARFYFDPNSIAMASGNVHFIFNGFMGTSTAVLQVEFRYSSGAYQVRGRLINDGSTWTNTNWFTISDARHFIELDWRAATAVGANNGGLTLWIDGTQQANLTTVDNDTRRIDRVRLGAVAGIDAGTSGTYYFDAFESRRQSFIGP